MLDANVQKVVNAGFSLDVAEWALRNSKNDPVKAIKELRAVSSWASLSTSSQYYPSIMKTILSKTHLPTVLFIYQTFSQCDKVRIEEHWFSANRKAVVSIITQLLTSTIVLMIYDAHIKISIQ